MGRGAVSKCFHTHLFSPSSIDALQGCNESELSCGRRCGGPGGLQLLLLFPARLGRRGGGGGGGGGNPGGGGGARGWLLSSPGRLQGPYLGPPRLGQGAASDWARMAAPLTRVAARCESARREEESARRPWA